MNNIIYHNLGRVKAIYNNTINVDIGNIQERSKAVQIRHDIVHRNGKNKNGNNHAITKEDIIALADSVSSFIERIENRPFFQAGKSLPF